MCCVMLRILARVLPLLAAALLAPLHTATADEPHPHPDTCRVGVYILSVFDLDYPHNAFSADFWMWFLYSADSLNPLESVEISNAKSSTFQNGSTEKKGGVYWAAQKCKATLSQNWDIANFPFDHQVLRIAMEDADRDTSDLVYLPDTAQSRLDPRVKLDGWRISKLRFVRQDARYGTNYGDPELASASTYPSVVAYVELTRDGLGLVMKLFAGVYVAFAICMTVFFFGPEAVEPRFGLLVGALFAAVANKYIVDSFLPMSVRFTLVDRIHVITFIYILLAVAVAVVVMNLYRKSPDDARFAKLSHRIDRLAFWVLLATYAAINAFYIIGAQ